MVGKWRQTVNPTRSRAVGVSMKRVTSSDGEHGACILKVFRVLKTREIGAEGGVERFSVKTRVKQH